MENEEKKEILLKVRGAKTYFPIKKGLMKRTVGYVKAVDDINLDVYRGETLGLVGESGCGKTTLGKSILQLVPVTEGSMEYKFEDGYKDLRKLTRKELDNARQKIQIVFQDCQSRADYLRRGGFGPGCVHSGPGFEAFESAEGRV